MIGRRSNRLLHPPFLHNIHITPTNHTNRAPSPRRLYCLSVHSHFPSDYNPVFFFFLSLLLPHYQPCSTRNWTTGSCVGSLMERREPIPFPFLLFLCQPLICLDRCLPSLWCLLFSGPLFHFLSLSDIVCCLSHLSKAAHRPTCMHTFTVCAFGCHRCLTLRSLYSVKVVENGNRDESSARHSGPGSTSGMFLTLTHTHTHTHTLLQLITRTHRS